MIHVPLVLTLELQILSEIPFAHASLPIAVRQGSTLPCLHAFNCISNDSFWFHKHLSQSNWYVFIYELVQLDNKEIDPCPDCSVKSGSIQKHSFDINFHLD